MLSLGIFDYFLQKKYSTHHKGKWNDKASISNIRICSDRDDLENVPEDCLLIYKNDSKTDSISQLRMAGSLPILQIIESAEIKLPEPCPWMEGYYLLTPKDQYHKVINFIFQLICNYQAFEHCLSMPCKTRSDFLETVKYCEDFLSLRIYIVDRHYHADFHPTEKSYPYTLELDDTNSMSDENINNLYLMDPDFDETFKTHGLHLYAPENIEQVEGDCYYYNIFQGDYYVARFLFFDFSLSRSEKIKQLMSFCAFSLSENYLKVFYPDSHHKTFLAARHLLIRMYSGEQISIKEAASILAIPGFNIFQNYQVIKLSSKGYVISEETLDYYISKIEFEFPGSLAVIRGNCVMCLFNLDVLPAQTIRKKLPAFLRENLFEAGLSLPFDNFMDLKKYGEEADIALAIGKEVHPDQWIHAFETHTLLYCMLQIKSEFPKEDLYHPALKNLLAYDQAHPETELVKTLEIYLNTHFNAQQAANKLHIHRTTFLYRMEKINSICNLNLDNTREVLHLLLSYELMKG